MGRRFFLALGLVAGLATAQVIIFDVPDPLELAHLDAGSIYTDYVQAGRVDAGSMRTDWLEVGIIDGGTVYGGRFANADGGRVEAPAGVNVQTGSLVDFGSGASVYRAGGSLVVNGGGVPVVSIDGHQVQGILEANTLAVDSAELVGGTGSVTLRTAAGVGTATPDAGLILEAGGPNGVVTVTRDAGVQTRLMRYIAWPALDVPACTQAIAGSKTAYKLNLADGGVYVREQLCSGEHWESGASLLGIDSAPKAGNGPFFRYDPLVPFTITNLSASVYAPGLGAGTFELILRQGSQVQCRGGTICTAASPISFPVACTGRTVYVSPDGGLAHALVGELDGGCAQTPGFNAVNSITVYGYPDNGWLPP